MDTISDTIVFENFEGGVCQAYLQSYDSFRTWACHSFDDVKSELVSLCLPLFVHSYIALIKRNSPSIAKEFWKSFEHGPPDLISSYGDELRELSSLLSKDQLQSGSNLLTSCNFIRCALTSKFRVRMSRFAVKLLAEYLHRDENLLIASIMNERVDITLADASELLVSQENPEGKSDSLYIPTHVLLPGYTPSACTPTSVGDVNLRVLGKVPLKIAGQVPKAKSITEDKLQQEWLKHIIKPQVLLSKKRKPSLSASTASVVDDNDEDASADSSLAAAALDSTILFSTVVNTADSMTCMHISSECRQIVAGFRDHSVRLWYLDTKDLSGLPGRLLGSARERNFVPFSQRNSENGASSSSSSAVNRTKFEDTCNLNERTSLTLYGHSRPIYGITQDASARFILSASGDETVRLWDTAVAQCIGKFDGICPFWGVSYSPIGYYFATANQDKTASLYSIDQAHPLRLFTGHVSDVTCVDWHQNGTYIASGSDDRTCRLFDIRQASTARLLQGCPSSINCVSCSKDGRLLAAGTDGGSIHIWDLLTGKALAVLTGHSGPVYTTAFSEDSLTLASGGADYGVKVWSLSCFTDEELNLAGKGSIHKDFDASHPKFLIKPFSTFNTKYTPVYYLNYTSKNMMYAGGPFSMSAISK